MDETNLLEGLDIELPAEVPSQGELSHQAPLIEGPGNELERQFLGPYELIARIGHGGVAIVYRARHMHPGYAHQLLAIKVLHEHLSQDPKVIELFRREARVLSLIKHPNVVETSEAGVQDGRMFLVMEYIDGRDLENLLWRVRQLNLQVPQAILLHVVAEILRGLDYAHALRDFDNTALDLVHRDVNPANVFIAFDGRVKLGDFGVTSVMAAPNKRPGEVAGKVGYFSPEQLAGETTQKTADLFAVGVMLFEILSGQRLFEATTPEASMRKNAAAKVPDLRALAPQVSEGLIEVTLKALARRPADRFQTANDMLAALAPYLAERRAVTLALRSLMRTAFVLDHSRELTLRQRLHGVGPRHRAVPIVDIITTEAEAQRALAQLLEREGLIPRVHVSVESLYTAQAKQPAPVVLWGLQAEEVAPGHSPGTALPQAHVIAMGRSLDADAIAWAINLGAEDLLFRPLPPERVLNAVRAGVAAREQLRAQEPPIVPQRLRMLVITDDLQLLGDWHKEFGAQGYQVAHVTSIDRALLQTERRSYELVVVDTRGAPPDLGPFIEAYRNAPVMGTVPMLLLTEHAIETRAEVPWPRAAYAPLSKPFGPGVEAVLRMGANGNTRTYARFDTGMPLKVRFGGRMFDAEAINVSRGGLLIHTAHLPSINTELGLVMDLGDRRPVEAQGTALRVLLGRPRDQDAEGARIGIALRRFVGDGEARFIARIMTLASEQPERARPNLTERARGWLQGLQRL